jgi:acetyl-CoA acetyltransferase
MSAGVSIIGAGLSKFGRQPDKSGRDLALDAIHAALADAGLAWTDVQVAFGGSDRSGAAEIALAVGFDKHPRGAFDPRPEDWGLPSAYGEAGLMVTTQFFGIKIARYLREHGISERTLALVAEKAYANGSLNPNAWRREPISADEIAAADMVNDPLTRFMFCSPGEGGAAIVLASESAAARVGRAVRVLGAATRTRRFGSFEVFSPSIQGTGRPSSVSADAAAAAFAAAGVTPDEVDVAQLQDTESGAEIMHLAECGFCKDGEQEAMIAAGETAIGGRLPVNTDGGCIANGEPIGASGLRQVHEIVTQLRGEAGDRQVRDAHGRDPRIGFTHVYGAPGISACTVLAVQER